MEPSVAIAGFDRACMQKLGLVVAQKFVVEEQKIILWWK